MPELFAEEWLLKSFLLHVPTPIAILNRIADTTASFNPSYWPRLKGIQS